MSIMYTLLKHSSFMNSLDNCRAARVSEANDRVLFEICIHIIIYVHTLHKQMLQLRKLDVCTLRRMALQLRSLLFSGFLRSVAFLLQAVRSQSIGFRRRRRDPSPTLLCAGAMPSGQLFGAHIVRRFPLGSLHLHKRWITLCWCTK